MVLFGVLRFRNGTEWHHFLQAPYKLKIKESNSVVPLNKHISSMIKIKRYLPYSPV
jgi:hypothetical protein